MEQNKIINETFEIYKFKMANHLEGTAKWYREQKKLDVSLPENEKKFLLEDVKELFDDYFEVRVNKMRTNYGLCKLLEFENKNQIFILQPTFIGMAGRLSFEKFGEDILYKYQKEYKNTFEDKNDKRKYAWAGLSDKFFDFVEGSENKLGEQIPSLFRDLKDYRIDSDFKEGIFKNLNKKGFGVDSFDGNFCLFYERGGHEPPIYSYQISQNPFNKDEYKKSFEKISEIIPNLDRKLFEENLLQRQEEYKKIWSKVYPELSSLIKSRINQFGSTDLEKRLDKIWPEYDYSIYRKSHFHAF